MKMHFTMVLNGEYSMDHKFKEALAKNPELHMELIQGMFHVLMMCFGWRQTDNITVESFRAGKMEENNSNETVLNPSPSNPEK